jgi:hypothetical protein
MDQGFDNQVLKPIGQQYRNHRLIVYGKDTGRRNDRYA